jgi:hypothetical protein
MRALCRSIAINAVLTIDCPPDHRSPLGDYSRAIAANCTLHAVTGDGRARCPIAKITQRRRNPPDRRDVLSLWRATQRRSLAGLKYC